MVGKSAGILCGGVQENQEFIVVIDPCKVRATVAIEVCDGYGLRTLAIGEIKINRIAPGIALGREKSKNWVTGGRVGRKRRQNAANFVRLREEWMAVAFCPANV